MGFAQQVDSSAIAQVVYRSSTKVLLVLFAAGRSYRYEGVSEEVAYGILSADSAGSYVNKNIVKVFGATEIDAADFDAAYEAEELSGVKGFVLTFPGMFDASFLTWKRAA